ncbi:unnamed protein product, partial [Choristocarpus tenellus]
MLASLSADRIRLGVLAADMSCFKVANPRSVLADFLRWYSPANWLVRRRKSFLSFSWGR